MTLYGGIDLHSNNNVVALTDETDRVVYRKRLANNVETVLAALAPYREEIAGLVVESTYNWYWLVDALMEAGYRVHLANTAAIMQYSGLKYADDDTDAAWLAKLLRLGLLPEGYIYPKAERAVRDLLRRRQPGAAAHGQHPGGAEPVLAQPRALDQRQRGTAPDPGVGRRAGGRPQPGAGDPEHGAGDAWPAGGDRPARARSLAADEGDAGWRALQSVSGIGRILGLTIVLETGPIERFKHVGNYASYCRCVGSTHVSNGKQKGKGNTKNGNKYLAWAYVEAANFAVRYNPQIKRYYQRKRAKTKGVVAIKAVAHKLARACYHILRDGSAFDVNRAFA
jgi:transposase